MKYFPFSFNGSKFKCINFFLYLKLINLTINLININKYSNKQINLMKTYYILLTLFYKHFIRKILIYIKSKLTSQHLMHYE